MREKLMKIQTNLKVQKNQFNKEGGFRYRSAEDILKALKPYEKKYRFTTVLSDSIELIGDRYYVKSIATIFDLDSEEIASVTAYARECSHIKGMDDAQLTGMASSYARKYALNALFLLDDSKDADTEEYTKQASDQDKVDAKEIALLREEMERTGTLEEVVLNTYKLKTLEDMNQTQYVNCKKKFEKTKTVGKE